MSVHDVPVLDQTSPNAWKNDAELYCVTGGLAYYHRSSFQ